MTLRRTPLVLLSCALLAAPLRAGGPDPIADIQQTQQQAEAIKAQAEACARMKCPECDCASLAKMMQALVDAETVMDALHNALIDADADARQHYFDLAANSHLTGVKLAQLQESLRWQEAFHKFGSYMLKIASILDTLNDIDEGDFTIDASSALDVLDKFDTLGNLLKNAADLTVDFSEGVTYGSDSASGSSAKSAVNLAADIKSEAVDAAKVARDIRKEFKKNGAKGMVDAIKKSRNLLKGIGRALKVYSEFKIKEEKKVLKELSETGGPEAEALTRAFQEWQKVREQMFSAEDALASIRAARDALSACMAKAKCGSQSLSRPTLGPFSQLGEALRALRAKLPEIAAALKGGISVKDHCPEPTKTTPPPPPEKPGTPPVTPLPPTKHVVENNCPKCSGIALELARTLDEKDFVVSELQRIRQNLEKAKDLEKDAEILRDSIKRISDLIDEFRNGKKDRNALQKAGDALFGKLGVNAHKEIDIETLEREKNARQNQLKTIERKIAALRAEEGKLPQLEKDNLRLFELAKKLEGELAECQKRCLPPPPPPPPPMTNCYRKKFDFDQADLRHQKSPTASHKVERESALKKLCECLKEHPEEMSEELRKLCPEKSIGMVPGKPGKLGNSLVGFVYSSDTQPNDRILGTVVDNPKEWEDSPLVTVVELAGRFPIDDAGRPSLRETTVSIGGGPAQPADQPVTCKIPPGGSTNVSVGTPDNPAPVSEKPVVCKSTGPTSALTPSDFQTNPVCVTGSVHAIDGPFAGDPKETSVSVSGEPAKVVTRSPRSCNYTLPETVREGPAITTCQVNGQTYSAETTVVALALSAGRTSLLRGESTDFSARVLHLDSIPTHCWETPYTAERIGRLLLSAAAPGMELPQGRPGQVLLVIENRSQGIISIDGESGGRIVVTIDRSKIKDGVFEFKGKIRSKQKGGFNIHVTVIPLMAPVHFRPRANS